MDAARQRSACERGQRAFGAGQTLCRGFGITALVLGVNEFDPREADDAENFAQIRLLLVEMRGTDVPAG